ncbi:MAG: ATP synthase F1 subunit delta [Chloroflexi bacterium]|nr:ATP synthase F1 subunit delta [Chloroflexota bacterium]
MARIAAARRYAQAIFMIAKEQGELEAWQKDLAQLTEGTSAPEMQALLANPKLPTEEKVKHLRARLTGLAPLVLNLASLLVQKGRIGLVADIAQEYGALYDTERGIEHARVTTAVPIDAVEQDRIARGLAALTGRQVVLEVYVDPTIIGGFVARVGDRVLDGSTLSQLQALRRSLVGG